MTITDTNLLYPRNSYSDSVSQSDVPIPALSAAPMSVCLHAQTCEWEYDYENLRD